MKIEEFVSSVEKTVNKFADLPEANNGINPTVDYEEEELWEWFESYVRNNGLAK